MNHGEFDDYQEEEPPKRKTYLLNSIRATTFSGKSIIIPKYDSLPPYFERLSHYDVTWVNNPPFDEINIDKISDIPYVDKYYAKSYSDLISHEKVNKQVLNWLRCFQKRTVPKPTKKGRKRRNAKNNDEPSVESSHILLLSGPPGCGKSTLIRVVASYCRYHIVEINASDDVKEERNQILLQNGLNFKPVFSECTRSLFVVEEMDGIGTITDSVIKAILNKTNVPVIVVVNDAYSPSIRDLRNHSTIVKMPPPPSDKFITRLKKIAENENLKYTPQAIADIAELSRFDMRTALNTLQFLALKQPITSELVHLMPVGLKNSTLGPFDVWSSLFLTSTHLDESLNILETFGNNNLISTGILENIEHVKHNDPTGHRYLEVLDGLCYSDIVHGELSSLGLASVPKIGTSHPAKQQLFFPSDSLGKEAMIHKNMKLLSHNPKLRENIQLIQCYLNPDPQLVHMLNSVTMDKLRERFIQFHKMIKINYKKNNFGHYVSEPDIDQLLCFNKNSLLGLSKFREMMQRELDKDQIISQQSFGGKRISDKLKSQQNKKSTVKDFWGQEITTQKTQVEERPTIIYKYNEGFTNAVRRKVYLERILKKNII
ncbi:chromosome transmission fidelity protein 18 [Histomonas meleagridis]|uniref:chromosome transmission fidelity protein 18 n=1 Tax=Histomonas meleagridis TaxID=135588 RepID=UPI00355A08EE|nr:chromosome transmission fidelity protein 18 [Histomonas meleagridis]KAH0805992.1 chromosome transmission fidelity protein 18 [Histomonas meleagridis]